MAFTEFCRCHRHRPLVIFNDDMTCDIMGKAGVHYMVRVAIDEHGAPEPGPHEGVPEPGTSECLRRDCRLMGWDKK